MSVDKAGYTDIHLQAKILLVGGYGAAGRAIAEAMLPRWQGSIVLAGRNSDKARQLAHALDGRAPKGTSFSGRLLDLDDRSSLRQALQGVSLVIVCTALTPFRLNHLIDAVIESGVDYIDIVPHPEKRALFQQHTNRIRASRSRFVLDSGADPGLPGWLIYEARRRWPDASAVHLQARYRSREIGPAGVADLLDTVLVRPLLYRRGWRRARPGSFRFVHFPGGLGWAPCVPVFLDEMLEARDELSLENLSLYHGGINPVTDALIVLQSLGLARLVGKERMADLFSGAARRFTADPTGLAIRAVADTRRRRLMLWHPDLYAATAAPVVVMAFALSGDSSLRPGYGYLGYWAHQIADFPERLERLGFYLSEDV